MADKEKGLLVPMAVAFTGTGPGDQRINFYDGASALFGFAKTIRLSTHYLKNGKVAFQAPTTKGVQLFMLPSKKGSYIQQIELFLDDSELVTFSSKGGYETVRATSEIIVDFTRCVLQRTMGKSIQPVTSVVDQIFSQREGDLDALSEALDGPLTEAHRTIAMTGGAVKLSTGDNVLASLNKETFEYLTTDYTSTKVERRAGSVAAFNVNSQKGRFYDDNLGRTVPFVPPPRTRIRDATPISWSLDQRTRGLDGTVNLFVRPVTSIADQIKRYILEGCERINRR